VAFYDVGLILGLIPLVAVAGGGVWPFLLVFPVTLAPIAGKTIRNLVYETHAISPAAGWLLYGVLPAALTLAAALWYSRPAGLNLPGREFARQTLLINAWLYFWLNHAIFQFPWPWQKWTARTPNGIAFTLCALGLTLACLTLTRRLGGVFKQALGRGSG
jgi:hypothetical protein